MNKRLRDGGFSVEAQFLAMPAGRQKWRLPPMVSFASLHSLAGQNSTDERQMSDLLSISEFCNKT